jgi:hypothetical protein
VLWKGCGDKKYMSKNIKIIILSTIIFLAAIVANIITSSKKVDNRILTVYSDISGNTELTKKIDTVVKSNNLETNITDDSKLKYDIELKYSIMISEDEKKNYDIFNIHDENIYSVASKDTSYNISYENIKDAIINNNEKKDSALIVFSANTYKWFTKYMNHTNSGAYYYGYLPKILDQDKTIVGIAFDSEIPNKKVYDVKLISNDSAGAETIKDTLCLLVKRGRLDTRISQDIVNELRKG